MKSCTRWALAMAAASTTIVFSACGDSHQSFQANWIADPNEAVKTAIMEKKPLLIAFTGSDWSPACQDMQREVIDTPQFKKFADQNLVLYHADFPRHSTLPTNVANSNAQWAKECHVDNLPTYLLVAALPSGQLTPIGGVAGTMPGEQFLNQLWRRIGVQITGETKSPGWVAIPIGGQLTLAGAVKLAGGPTPGASNYGMLVRTQPDGKGSGTAKVSVKDALEDPQKDFALQPGDTVRLLTPEESLEMKQP